MTVHDGEIETRITGTVTSTSCTTSPILLEEELSSP
jgi:hypothetical protein